MTEKERNLIEKFIALYFGEATTIDVAEEEDEIINKCLAYINTRFSKMKYILGTGLDFALLAQLLSNDDVTLKEYRPTFTKEDIFAKYKLVTERGDRKANTLSLSFNGGKDFGIRKIEENVLEFFHTLDRTDYPSAYVYNTGQWQKYQDLLEQIFKLSENGRYKLVNRLIEFGLKGLTRNIYYSRNDQRARIFEEIVENFPRGIDGENGGLIFQSIAFAYYKNDFSHLSIAVDKVRTGSSRQKRFGDIDCYFGLDLEISIEVKDFRITNENIYSQLGSLINNSKDHSAIGVAFVKEIDEAAKEILHFEDIRIITQNDLSYIISLWDWQKQNNGVHCILHYLAHIEQDPKAVNRLLKFISEIDPKHDSLVFFNYDTRN